MRIVILGLSITSSWGNGHATTYRGLVRELSRRGHRVTFLERDKPWYAANRDLPEPPYCATHLYRGVAELKFRYAKMVREADCVILGSYVPDGIAVGKWITQTAALPVFYDIDTPVTLANLERGACDYLSRELIPRFALYLSFTGGPTLERLQKTHGSPMARAFYCAVDPAIYFPHERGKKWHLGYIGTFSTDRQRRLQRLLIEPARRLPRKQFVVAGPKYPQEIQWPRNVRHIPHLAPKKHRGFYNSQRFTLNVTRADMMRAGYAPSVRLFEAAACGTPIITDKWDGLSEFFRPGRDILVARTAEDMVHILREMPVSEARRIGDSGRRRVLAAHTATHRAAELETLIAEASVSNLVAA